MAENGMASNEASGRRRAGFVPQSRADASGVVWFHCAREQGNNPQNRKDQDAGKVDGCPEDGKMRSFKGYLR
jgi:hypothetical protein